MIKLYVDCETDMEKASFFRSSRGWESGIVAKSLEGDLADVFAFRATVAEALAELWAQAEAGAEKWFGHHNEANIYQDFADSILTTITKLGLEGTK